MARNDYLLPLVHCDFSVCTYSFIITLFLYCWYKWVFVSSGWMNPLLLTLHVIQTLTASAWLVKWSRVNAFCYFFCLSHTKRIQKRSILHIAPNCWGPLRIACHTTTPTIPWQFMLFFADKMRRELYHSATFWIVCVEKDCGLFCGYLFISFERAFLLFYLFFVQSLVVPCFLRLFSDLAYFDVNTLPRDMKGNFVFPSVPKVRGTEIFADYFKRYLSYTRFILRKFCCTEKSYQ